MAKWEGTARVLLAIFTMAVGWPELNIRFLFNVQRNPGVPQGSNHGTATFLCFYFIYCCLNTLTRRIHHRCKHTENFNTIYCESSSQKNQVGNTEEGRPLVTEEEWKERENDRRREGGGQRRTDAKVPEMFSLIPD